MKKNILVPIDFSERSYKTLEQSYILAKIFDADITLLHVRQDTKKTYFFSLFSEEETNELKKKYLDKLHLKLKTITEDALKNHNIKVNAMLAKGRVFDKIIEIAETVNAEFIFLDKYTAETNSKDYIGTNASRIIRQAPCPVLIHNNFDFAKGFKTIVLPLDFSEGSRQKVSKAIELAKIFNSTIKVISAPFGEDQAKLPQLQVMSNQVEKFIKENGIKCSAEIVSPGENHKSYPLFILNYCKVHKADLIIIMTQQEVGWIKSYISSNAFETIRNAEIPVLSIVPKDINFMISKF